MSEIFYHGHLTIASAQKIKAGLVSRAELIAALSHIAECEKCAELYAACFKEEDLTEIPSGFGGSVIEKAKEAEFKARKSFAIYVAEVAVSACAALAITFSGAFNLVPECYQDMARIGKPVISFADSLKTNINTFSQNTIKKEVNFFEKKEK